MGSSESRQSQRAPVTLKIKFKSETVDQFIERYSVDVSQGGIFIRTKDPLTVGTTLRFEFQLRDATPLITGDGTVVWTREHDPSRAGVAPGMGVRFDRLSSESQEMLDRILEGKQALEAGGSSAAQEAFVDTPTRVVPPPVVSRLAKGTAAERFRSDADDFSSEAFEESTKVASLDALAATTAGKESSGQGDASPDARADLDELDDDADEPTNIRGGPSRETGAPLRAPQAEEVAADRSGGGPVEVHEERTDQASPPPAPQAIVWETAAGSRAEGAKAEPRAGDELADDPADDHGAQPSDLIATVKERLAADRAREDDHASVARASDLVDDDRSSLPWIAAAAALLLIVGTIGWWLLRDRGDPALAAEAPSNKAGEEIETIAGGAGEAADPIEPGEPIEEPPPATVTATVESVPQGAIAELVGEGQSGPTPFTFTGLVPDRTYEVKVSHDDYHPQELSLRAGEQPEPVRLEPLERALKLSSTPGGATILINGRRAGVTPATVPVTGLTDGERLAVTLRKTGYTDFELQVSRADRFEREASGRRLVHQVSATLARRPAPDTQRRPPRPPEEPTTGGGTGEAPKTDPPKTDPPKTDPPKTDPPKTDPPKTDPPKTDPPKTDDPGGPVPDWMK